MCICMYVCMYIYIYIYICIHTHRHHIAAPAGCAGSEPRFSRPRASTQSLGLGFRPGRCHGGMDLASKRPTQARARETPQLRLNVTEWHLAT